MSTMDNSVEWPMSISHRRKSWNSTSPVSVTDSGLLEGWSPKYGSPAANNTAKVKPHFQGKKTEMVRVGTSCAWMTADTHSGKQILHSFQIKKRCRSFFHSTIYKCASIFTIFGMLLRNWILIMLVNLLLYVSRWRYVDVDEIMPFTDEHSHHDRQRYPIQILRKEKRYSFRKFIRELFSNKNGNHHGLSDHLIKKIDQSDSIAW